MQNLIVWDELKEEDKVKAEEAGLKIYSFQEVIEAGKEAQDLQFAEIDSDSVFMFSYTSGTTGNPKAVKLTHRMVLANLAAGRANGLKTSFDDVIISYLPLAHSMEQSFINYALAGGLKYGFYSGDILKLMDDIQALKPTIFPSVPRLFNKMYDKITATIKEKG